MINLLPPKYKKELKQQRFFKVVIALNILVLSFLLILSGVLFLTKISLQEELKSQQAILKNNQEQKKIKKIKNLESEIKSFNDKIEELQDYYQNYFNLTDIINDFSSTLPDGVYINSISFDKIKNKEEVVEVKVQGYCPDRERLREFDSNLNKTEKFTEINFAKENWTQPKEINFSLSFKIKK